MRLKQNSSTVRLLCLISALLWHVMVPTGAGAQDSADTVNPRAFWNSLTPAERKLPRDILTEQRLAAGKVVPPGWERSAQAQARNRSADSADRVYRLDGESVESLDTVLSQIGASAMSRSLTRAYVTAVLNHEQVVEAARYAAVYQIRYVKGPSAQGVTQAWQAHRVAGIDEAGEPSNIPTKPALTGNGVVIGIISKTVKQADLDALVNVTNVADEAGSCLIPPVYQAADTCAGNDGLLYLLNGISDSQGALPNVLSTSGSDDALNILQVIYDIAPDAQFIIASPGDTSTPADMARVIAKLAAGNNLDSTSAADYIPKANLIIDDLRYDTQNPFEIDEISEAIVAAKSTGVGYISSAGDGGHHESASTTSNVHIDDFDSQPPPNNTGIYGEIFGNLHRFGGTQAYLTLTESLSDVCLFWNEDPDGPNTTDDLTLWIFQDTDNSGAIDNNEPASDWYALTRPGGCLSEQGSWAGGTLPVDTKLIIEDFTGTITDRFLIEGVRASTAIVNTSTGADSVAGAFNLTTPGSIRGHAYHPDVLTVGASPFFEDSGSVQTFKDGVAASKTLTANDYSADGEAEDQPRFYWENNGTSSPNWEAVADGGLTVAKPDLLATSAISVKEVADCDADNGTADAVCTGRAYYGTSASAAVATGVSALYWQFRQWQVGSDQNDDLTAVSAPDVLNAVKASTLDGGSAGWDVQFGFGVLDAPKGLETALPASNASLSGSSPGVLKLDFSKAFNDLSELFTYSVSCTPASANIPAAIIKANDVTAGTAGTDKAPMYYNVEPGTAVECNIISAHPEWSGSATATVSAVATFMPPPTVSMTSKSGGVNLRVASSSGNGTVTYTAVCLRDGSPISGWTQNDNQTVLADTDYGFAAEPGKTVTCDVIASAARDGASPVTETSTAGATANFPADTVLQVRADAGGVGVSWIVDPNLADGATATVTLTCTQGGATVLGPQQMTGNGTFIEADTSAPVSCSATTQLSVPGATLTSGSVSASATPLPEEEVSSGLPIWLLYIATQPQTKTGVDAFDTFDSNSGVPIDVKGDSHVGQTFTAGHSGELKSVKLYLRNGGSASAGLTLDIKAVSGGQPSGASLLQAASVIPNSDVGSAGGGVQSVTVTFTTPPELVSGQEYAILVSTTDTNAYHMWHDSSNSDYSGGTAILSSNGGTTWSNAAYDFSFETVMSWTE